MARQFWSVGVAVLCLGTSAWADLTNGGFEAGLTGWNSEGLVQATDYEGPRDEPEDESAEGWKAVEGIFFASLWSWDSDSSSAGHLWQEFTADAGSVLSFNYFFDFAGSATAPDTAWATLTSVGTGASITLFEHNTTGHELDDNDNVGWTPISYTLTSGGDYNIEFFIEDFDGETQSVLGVDDVALTAPQAIPAPGAMVLALIGLTMVSRLRRYLA